MLRGAGALEPSARGTRRDGGVRLQAGAWKARRMSLGRQDAVTASTCCLNLDQLVYVVRSLARPSASTKLAYLFWFVTCTYVAFLNIVLSLPHAIKCLFCSLRFAT